MQSLPMREHARVLYRLAAVLLLNENDGSFLTNYVN